MPSFISFTLELTSYNHVMGNKWKDYKPQLDDLISLRQASKISGLTTNHLRLMISREKLWAWKIDSLWVTTKEALEDYLNNRDKPGRKPQKPLN